MNSVFLCCSLVKSTLYILWLECSVGMCNVYCICSAVRECRVGTKELVYKLSSPNWRTSYILQSSVFRNISTCGPLKVKHNFGGTCRLHLQSRRITKQETSVKASGKQSLKIPLKMEATCSSEMLVDFHRKSRHCVPEDRTLTATAVRTSRPTSFIFSTYCLSAAFACRCKQFVEQGQLIVFLLQESAATPLSPLGRILSGNQIHPEFLVFLYQSGPERIPTKLAEGESGHK
jgi:hypothetical protein